MKRIFDSDPNEIDGAPNKIMFVFINQYLTMIQFGTVVALIAVSLLTFYAVRNNHSSAEHYYGQHDIREQKSYPQAVALGPTAQTTTTEHITHERHRHPVPHTRVPKPSLPILFTQPSTPYITSYHIKYLNQHDEIVEECMRETMAKTIPHERIFPSTLTEDGEFAQTCPNEEAVPYQAWPF